MSLLGLMIVPAEAAVPAPANNDVQLMLAFKSICLDTGAEAAKVGAVATASGWRKVAQTPNEVANGARRFEKSDTRGQWLLMVENSVKPADSGLPLPTRRKACFIFASPDSANANSAMASHIGVAPTNRDGAMWYWNYIDHGKSREYFTTTAADLRARAIAGLKSGPWVVIAAGPRNAGQTMMYNWVSKADR
jgi:hypothetical protein